MPFNNVPPDQFNKVDEERGVSHIWHLWFLRAFRYLQSTPALTGVQSTSGGAGTAQALPTNPVTYLRVQMPDGKEYVIPAYTVT